MLLQKTVLPRASQPVFQPSRAAFLLPSSGSLRQYQVSLCLLFWLHLFTNGQWFLCELQNGNRKKKDSILIIDVHQGLFLTLNISLWVLCGSDSHFLTLEPMLQSQPVFGELLVIKVARETERDTPWAIRRQELELTCTSAHISLVELIIFPTEHVGGRKCNPSVCWDGTG